MFTKINESTVETRESQPDKVRCETKTQLLEIKAHCEKTLADVKAKLKLLE